MIITRELIPSKVSVRKRGRFSLKKRKLSYVSDFALPSSRLIAIFVLLSSTCFVNFRCQAAPALGPNSKELLVKNIWSKHTFTASLPSSAFPALSLPLNTLLFDCFRSAEQNKIIKKKKQK